MQGTPRSNRKHIGFFGKRNAGKSSLFNAVLGQNLAIVSEMPGTTTDPVSKAMELLDFGPVVWTDTAGLDDVGALGAQRVDKALETMQKMDFAVYVMDASRVDKEGYESAKRAFKQFHVPFVLVMNKIDLLTPDEVHDLEEAYGEAIFVSSLQEKGIQDLISKMVEGLNQSDDEPSLIGDLLPYGSTVVMVVPIDSEAPKGRLILPQVQLLRDCLDHGILCHVVRDTELQRLIDSGVSIDLVVTDSQAFHAVSQIVPRHIYLTGFSVLFARQKGDLRHFLKGIDALKSLNESSRVLIAESCTHNHSHEDIGRVKIPNLLKQNGVAVGNIDFAMGGAYHIQEKPYDLVIHCGGCMLTQKAMHARLNQTLSQSVPMTNYGLVLAYYSGILERSIELLEKELL